MKNPYEDIIFLPHPVSPTRKRMSRHDRAAQFSPFAALNGHEAAIQETARRTDAPIDLAADGTAMLDQRIRLLMEHQQEQPAITAAYFIPDTRKQGGAYVTVSGTVKAVLPREQTILLSDGTELWFRHIYRLDSPLFPDL